MENWEKELREKLEKELPNRWYRISDILVQKPEYIDFEVARHKRAIGKSCYNKLTYEMIDEFIKDIFNK